MRRLCFTPPRLFGRYWLRKSGWGVNTSMSTIYIFFGFHDIKILYVLKSICIINRALMVSDLVLARRYSEKVFNRP